MSTLVAHLKLLLAFFEPILKLVHGHQLHTTGSIQQSFTFHLQLLTHSVGFSYVCCRSGLVLLVYGYNELLFQGGALPPTQQFVLEEAQSSASCCCISLQSATHGASLTPYVTHNLTTGPLQFAKHGLSTAQLYRGAVTTPLNNRKRGWHATQYLSPAVVTTPAPASTDLMHTLHHTCKLLFCVVTFGTLMMMVQPQPHNQTNYLL